MALCGDSHRFRGLGADIGRVCVALVCLHGQAQALHGASLPGVRHSGGLEERGSV